MNQPRNGITLAMTGASGAPYALRLLERLLLAGERVDLVISEAGRELLRQECGLDLGDEIGAGVVARLGDFFTRHAGDAPPLTGLRHFGVRDWQAPLASGSSGARAMVVCPCSMGTLAAIAHGLSDNLLERAADVALKERWPLILVTRETPLSVIHLENMLAATRAGAVILPASPGFYHRPERIDQLLDFIVDRILMRLGVPIDAPSHGWPIHPADGRDQGNKV
ncbi:MAG: UbiX family flavin prenyltransferase [Magnetococcales bacterium]|nr:UbiX family flavin prenyltransferase [Magnetococcales bacterium]